MGLFFILPPCFPRVKGISTNSALIFLNSIFDLVLADGGAGCYDDPQSDSPAVLRPTMDVPNAPDNSNSTGKNRRSAVRKRLRTWAKLECRKRGTMGPNIAEVIWDLSQTGVCLVVNTAVEIGDELELEIASTGLNQTLKTVGTVIWIDPLDNKKYSIGLRFLESLTYAQVSHLTH
jgi:hypothetical protein